GTACPSAGSRRCPLTAGRGRCPSRRGLLFFFNDTATPEIYTLSLHDALPIWTRPAWMLLLALDRPELRSKGATPTDRKSTRLNSSHANSSYAVFCLKKKK